MRGSKQAGRAVTPRSGAPRSAATELGALLDSPEIERLIAELDETRWTGRPGYPLRAMVGMALAKSLYSIPTWTKSGFAADTCALDKGYDVSLAYDACEGRDVRPVIPLRETPAVKRGAQSRRRASMASGGSPDRTPSVVPRSGAALPGHASRKAGGSRRTAFTPWSPGSRSGGSPSTEAAPPSSASSGGSRTSGRCSRSACGGSSLVRLHADLTILAKLACRLA